MGWNTLAKCIGLFDNIIAIAIAITNTVKTRHFHE